MDKIDFSQVFEEICTKHGAELEKLRKINLLKSILVLTPIIVITYILIAYTRFRQLYFFILLFDFIVYGAAESNIYKKYTIIFKKNLIQRLIESKKCDYIYRPESGVTSKEYKESGFDKKWDDFYSEDRIEGTINSVVKFKMSQVRTVFTDEKGYATNTIFYGLYGIITLPKSVGGNIDIISNSNIRKFSKTRLNLESVEFEKYYDVNAKDKIWAMQVLNSEAIKDLIDLRNYFNKTISIRIVKNKIFFRLPCGDVFEPSKLRKSVRYDLLYKYYRLIDIPRYIYDALILKIAYVDNNTKEES